MFNKNTLFNFMYNSILYDPIVFISLPTWTPTVQIALQHWRDGWSM